MDDDATRSRTSSENCCFGRKPRLRSECRPALILFVWTSLAQGSEDLDTDVQMNVQYMQWSLYTYVFHFTYVRVHIYIYIIHIYIITYICQYAYACIILHFCAYADVYRVRTTAFGPFAASQN